MTEGLNTGRKRSTKREMWFRMCTVVRYNNILGVSLTVSLYRQSPCQYSGQHHPSGLPWAPDRVLCGWDWILWWISGIYGDKQTATVYFHACCRKLNLVALLLISILPAWILTRTGGVGRKDTEGDISSSTRMCSDFIQHFLGAENNHFLPFPEFL